MATAPAARVRFEPETIVADALELHPKARRVFAMYALSGCSGCGMAYEETLEQLADSCGIELEELLAELNALWEEEAAV